MRRDYSKASSLIGQFVDCLHGDDDISHAGNADLPSITVVTPSYNQGIFLERTILSVLNQAYPKLEYLIMDGGSSDESVSVIKKYAHRLSGWWSEADEGQTHAIQKGFERAQGEIMAWLNSDDMYTPGVLRWVASYFQKHPNVDVIYGDSYIVDVNDGIMREIRSVPFSKWGFLTDSFSLHQASIFWRSELYRKTAGLDISLYLTMDRDLWFKFYNAGARFKHTKKILSCYRVHNNTKTSRYSQKSAEIRNRLRKQMFAIDADGRRFKLIRPVMRLRTAAWHALMGNIAYLLSDSGREYYD